jgi:hypothetical protein
MGRKNIKADAVFEGGGVKGSDFLAKWDFDQWKKRYREAVEGKQARKGKRRGPSKT